MIKNFLKNIFENWCMKLDLLQKILKNYRKNK